MTIKFKTFINDINKELTKLEKLRVREASNLLKNKLKDKISLRYGQESNLYKGVTSQTTKGSTKVGMGPPAYNAHLIEFGTDDRYSKTGKYSGHVSPNPFVFPTFEENIDEVNVILSKKWL